MFCFSVETGRSCWLVSAKPRSAPPWSPDCTGSWTGAPLVVLIGRVFSCGIAEGAGWAKGACSARRGIHRLPRSCVVKGTKRHEIYKWTYTIFNQLQLLIAFNDTGQDRNDNPPTHYLASCSSSLVTYLKKGGFHISVSR